MPLIKGKVNMPADSSDDIYMDRAQDLAIALGVQRANRRKKMAEGGSVPDKSKETLGSRIGYPGSSPTPKPREDEEKSSSIYDSIFSKRSKMADGGQVDIQENGDESPTDIFDEDNSDAILREIYDDSELESQPEDSNMHGSPLNTDEGDTVAKIRLKYKIKK